MASITEFNICYDYVLLSADFVSDIPDGEEYNKKLDNWADDYLRLAITANKGDYKFFAGDVGSDNTAILDALIESDPKLKAKPSALVKTFYDGKFHYVSNCIMDHFNRAWNTSGESWAKQVTDEYVVELKDDKGVCKRVLVFEI